LRGESLDDGIPSPLEGFDSLPEFLVFLISGFLHFLKLQLFQSRELRQPHACAEFSVLFLELFHPSL
jgi:hypothetical protein